MRTGNFQGLLGVLLREFCQLLLILVMHYVSFFRSLEISMKKTMGGIKRVSGGVWMGGGAASI